LKLSYFYIYVIDDLSFSNATKNTQKFILIFLKTNIKSPNSKSNLRMSKESNELFDLKTAFFLGNFNQAINEAQKLKVLNTSASNLHPNA